MKKHADVDVFLKLCIQIECLVQELSVLSKKKPDDALNTFKLKLVNEILAMANGFLNESLRPLSGFEGFGEDAVPTNSDALIVVSQYRACLEKYRNDHVAFHDYKPYWVIAGKCSSLEAPTSWSEIVTRH